MRVTQSMLSQNSLKHIQNNYQKLGKLEEQLYTGKKVNRPSDDPVAAMKGVNYRSQVTAVSQYQRNLGEVYNWMDNTESALDETNKIIQRIRDLTVQASSDSYDAGQRKNVASEIEQLRNQLETIANTKVNNKYIFNGSDTTNKPVDLKKIDQNVDISTIDANNAKDYVLFDEKGSQLVWNESSNAFKAQDGTEIGFPIPDSFVAKEKGAVASNAEGVKIEVSAGIHLDVNSKPQNVFSLDLFKDIGNLIDKLKSPDTTADDLSGELDMIDHHHNNVISEMADIGAKSNRVEMVESRLGNQEILAKTMMSNNEDIDAEKVIIELTSQEALHRASLAVGASIIQPTLMDFLR
ncbi:MULTISPECIES: flagellar hook-associated protein FlgL [Cytobacillus]|uniref:flagellar hook-associated protein FlgL n=1 Tax=Cytobacillus TaxID=2675230 RepID=UPI00203B16C8|nr:flagellar hook-associated protein FlgL [Cytobacillus kochii]MCM3322764.1 flagellar hook-associated protein FlgL [Cytobacillus kochii]MCM3344757.1 flagellar hook-associated protein FlgL [Cytobacillus kochii]MDM5209300.1 flagellar hook-associated protein FlgL [Cytobacillus kochii]